MSNDLSCQLLRGFMTWHRIILHVYTVWCMQGREKVSWIGSTHLWGRFVNFPFTLCWCHVGTKLMNDVIFFQTDSEIEEEMKISCTWKFNYGKNKAISLQYWNKNSTFSKSKSNIVSWLKKSNLIPAARIPSIKNNLPFYFVFHCNGCFVYGQRK